MGLNVQSNQKVSSTKYSHIPREINGNINSFNNCRIFFVNLTDFSITFAEIYTNVVEKSFVFKEINRLSLK